jgi:hypothetical protein
VGGKEYPPTRLSHQQQSKAEPNSASGIGVPTWKLIAGCCNASDIQHGEANLKEHEGIGAIMDSPKCRREKADLRIRTTGRSQFRCRNRVLAIHGCGGVSARCHSSCFVARVRNQRICPLWLIS